MSPFTPAITQIASREGGRSPEETEETVPAELVIIEEAGIGIILCCGRRLDWSEVEDSPVLEASCASCRTTYAMDTCENLEEPDEIGLEAEVVRCLLRDALLREGLTPASPPRLGFAG